MERKPPVLHWAREAFEQSEEDREMLAYAKEHFDLSPVIEQFGSWAVTEYGIECLEREYEIEKGRLGEDWPYHMSGKSWVNMCDFMDAYETAKRVHHRGKTVTQIRRKALSLTPSQRFWILQRDGFRCRLCGRTADDGIKLHVDHKVAIACGGGKSLENLWTLCQECNAGKAARYLEALL